MNEKERAQELRRLARTPAIAEFLNAVLDRRDRQGRFPKTIVLRWDADKLRALDPLLPAACVRQQATGGALVALDRLQAQMEREDRDHGREPASLEALFDAATGRTPGNREAQAAAEVLEWGQAAQEGWAAGRARARAFLQSADGAWESELEAFGADLQSELQIGRGPWAKLGREAGTAALGEEMARFSAALHIALAEGRADLRLDQLAVAAAGDSKALRPGSAGYRRFFDALQKLRAGPPEETGAAETSPAHREREALEAMGLFTNEAPLDVLVRGDFAFEIGADLCADARTLAGHGLAAKITLNALRRATRMESRAEAVLCVENETAFHLCADAYPERLIVFTGGQAGWAVSLLLQGLARAQPGLRLWHAGDLDLAGLQILRALRRRTGLAIEALWMDGETFDLCRDLGLPIKPRLRAQVAQARASWGEDFGADVLERLDEGGHWIEQEAVLGRVLPSAQG